MKKYIFLFILLVGLGGIWKLSSVYSIQTPNIPEHTSSGIATITEPSNSSSTGNTTKEFSYYDSLRDFEKLPKNHQESVGYIFITSKNLDIRGADMSPEEYFKAIYFYQSGALVRLDFSDKNRLQKLYATAKKYINIIAERKLDRFSVGFTTKTYANNPKKPDIYISSEYLSNILFIHEFGHVIDYRYGYTDTATHLYPYKKRVNAITDYGAFHIGEDFAEAYRFYVLHDTTFQTMGKEKSEIQEKYQYMKQRVFSGTSYEEGF